MCTFEISRFLLEFISRKNVLWRDFLVVLEYELHSMVFNFGIPNWENVFKALGFIFGAKFYRFFILNFLTESNRILERTDKVLGTCFPYFKALPIIEKHLFLIKIISFLHKKSSWKRKKFAISLNTIFLCVLFIYKRKEIIKTKHF